MEFVPYGKTPRLKRSIVITEKIDGTNAQVVITTEAYENEQFAVGANGVVANDFGLVMRVGSRNRWITPGKDTDNFGFAGWCHENAAELFKLGVGQHFGEWWGQGVARGYGMDRKVFSLFNTVRWGSHNPETPACCSVVPVLLVGDLTHVDGVLGALRYEGSVASPGFMNPEGIIVYHSAAKMSFKVLLDNDEVPKGLS